MKIVMKKRIIAFVIFLLVVICLMPNVSKFVQAEESVGLAAKVNCIKEANKDVATSEMMAENNFIKMLTEDNLAIKMNEDILDIEELLASRNTDVTTELNRRMVQYAERLTTETSEENQEKIQNLLDITQQLSTKYQIYDNCIESYNSGYNTRSVISPIPSINVNLAPMAYVSAVISAFSTLGYELAAELTTVALTSTYVSKQYIPLYGSRVISSQVLYNISIGTATDGSSMFPAKDLRNTYEADLYFAIRRFNYTKPSWNSKTVIIADTYDYNSKEDGLPEDNGIQGLALSLMYQAQMVGVLHPVKLKIAVDTSEFLRLQIVSKTINNWNIAVTNYKNKPVDVVYNSKMCYESDLLNWIGLTHIKTIRLAANETKNVEVQENVMATHFAFSYHEGGNRFITYANETYLASTHNLNLDSTKVRYQNYGDIGIVGKNGNKWLINVTNIHNERKVLEYNAKLSFEGDAKNWTTGLKDVCNLGYINMSDSRIIEIQENAFATHIAIRLTGETEGILIYANQLSTNCTMNVSRVTNYIYNYLYLSNSGKSGSSWLINITNPTSSTITVSYNTKMCFEGDAKNWTGLNNKASFTLGGSQTKQVSISTNGFATSITASFLHSNGKRVISYANGLNKNGGINVMYNYI